MGATDNAVEAVIWLLVALTSLTFVSLVSIDLWERLGGHGHGWRAYRHRRELELEQGRAKLARAQLVRQASAGSVAPPQSDTGGGLEDGDGVLARPSLLSKGDGSLRKFLPSAIERLEPKRIRAFLKGLIVFWAVLGLGLSVFLFVNFVEYVQDEKALQDEFAQLARQEARAALSSDGGGTGSSGGGNTLGSADTNADGGIVIIDADGNITGGGFSLFSDTFVLPAPLAEEVLNTAFTPIPEGDEGELYGIKWVTLRCARAIDSHCANLTEVLAYANSSVGFEVFWVAAPTGTNPAVLLLLVSALLLDSVTFLAFGLLIVVRTRANIKEAANCRRCTMCFEVWLLIVSLGILVLLIWGAVNTPIAYEGIAFVSPLNQTRTNVVVPMRVAGDRAKTEPGTSNYIFELDAETTTTHEWCLTLPEVAALNNRYGLVPGVTETALLTGASAAVPSQPLCRSVGGVASAKTISSADYWSEIISYVRTQVLGQGAAVDGLLLLMDALMLAASYMFLII